MSTSKTELVVIHVNLKIYCVSQFFNVVSFVESVRLVVPYIKESGGGSILSISSVASHIPSISMAVYGAAKVRMLIVSFDSIVYRTNLYRRQLISMCGLCP